ncbi:MAG: hypothetical protein JW888_13335 [Pirellulales bacterium]|nr:hypothetical protein [Pirellulales bacterium]
MTSDSDCPFSEPPQSEEPKEPTDDTGQPKPVTPPTPLARRTPLPQPDASPSAPLRDLARFLYCANPFYVVSTALIFWGLRISFETTGRSFETDALMIGLVSYTLLLAAAACVIIRLGQVWNDVRTVLLLVVLMLLTISVTFDEALANNTSVGQWYYFGGLLLAVVVTEITLRVIRLRLGWLFRGPYYLAFALFFLYPVAISPLTRDPKDPALLWAMFGFSLATALVTLTLLPAIWRGPQYVRDNGSPWRWPLYPWTLFGTLGLAAMGRSYYLCQSFHFVGGGATIFRPYFLAPLLVAINLLLLENGVRWRRKGVEVFALFMPIATVWLLFLDSYSPVNDLGFQRLFVDTLQVTPQYLMLVAVAVFYCYAALRGARGAIWGVTMALACLTVVGRTNALDAFVNPTGWPLLMAAVLHLGVAIEQRRPAPWFWTSMLLLAGLSIELRETWFMAYEGAIPMHFALLAVLVIGLVFKGSFAEVLQFLGFWALVGMSLVAVIAPPESLGNPPATLLVWYPIFVAAVATVYAWLAANLTFTYLWAVAGNLLMWIAKFGWVAYQPLRIAVKGLDLIVLGGVFFVVALAISLGKAGLYRRWLGRKGDEDKDSDA